MHTQTRTHTHTHTHTEASYMDKYGKLCVHCTYHKHISLALYSKAEQLNDLFSISSYYVKLPIVYGTHDYNTHLH